jgi:hypothetical protein
MEVESLMAYMIAAVLALCVAGGVTLVRRQQQNSWMAQRAEELRRQPANAPQREERP